MPVPLPCGAPGAAASPSTGPPLHAGVVQPRCTPVLRDTPSLQGSSGHCQPQGCPRGQGGFVPFLSPSDAWAMLGPSSPKAGVQEHQSRQGAGELGAAGAHWAGRPLQAAGMLCTPSSSSPRAEPGCSRAGPCVASGTSFLALSGSGLGRPPPVTAPSCLSPSWPHKTGGTSLHQTLPPSIGAAVHHELGSAGVSSRGQAGSPLLSRCICTRPLRASPLSATCSAHP